MNDLWPQLCTNTQRAISRKRKRFGHPYTYRPRGTLLKRLATENSISIEEAYRQLMDLRKELIDEQNQI